MKRGLVVLVALALVGASCGDGDGGPGKLDTGVNGSAPLGGLSQGDVDKICKALGDWANGLTPQMCRVTGVIAAAASFMPGQSEATLKTSCQTAYDACVKEPIDPTMCEKPMGNCTATVAEFEACVTDAGSVLAKLADPFPACSALTLSKLNDIAGMMEPNVMEPASCKKLSEKCPDFELPIEMP